MSPGQLRIARAMLRIRNSMSDRFGSLLRWIFLVVAVHSSLTQEDVDNFSEGAVDDEVGDQVASNDSKPPDEASDESQIDGLNANSVSADALQSENATEGFGIVIQMDPKTQAEIKHNGTEGNILDGNKTKDTLKAVDTKEEKNVAENATELNSTSSGLPKWFCRRGNSSEVNISLNKVLIVNVEELLQWVNTTTDNESDACAVVLFYTRYCPFCAKLAPLYNTLGRMFSNLPVLAIDAYKHHSLNTRFGVVAVPTILLFHSGKPVLKFNNSNNLDDLRNFVSNNTGIEGNYSIEVTEEDIEGPLPSSLTEERDNYLLFSVLFLVAFGCTMFAKSSYGQVLWDKVQGIQWDRVLVWFRREKQD